MKTLFKNADILLRKDSKYFVLSNAYLGVENDRICYIDEKAPADTYDCTKDMTNKLLMPGLFNCHNHAPMVLLRGIGSDLPLNEWLFNVVFPIEDRFTYDIVKAGTSLAAMEMLAGGTVSFSDMYFFSEAIIEAVIQSGMKGNIGRTVQSAGPDETPEQSYRIREALDLYNKYNNACDGRILVDFCLHAEYTCTEAITKAFIEMCNERNGLMHIHISETEKEHLECLERHSKTPAQWFADMGAFDSSACLAHCVEATDEDFELFKEKNVSVIHNPTSNMKLGSGFARIPAMTELGINVALGTDGAASNNNLNMFEEMHLASIIHNGLLTDSTVMNADTVIAMATANGAKLQRRYDSGDIKVGNKADIIALDFSKPHLTPAFDKKALVTYSAQASDVCMTMVDGKILYENGEYLTLDKEKIYYEFNKAVEKLYEVK